MNKMYLKLLRIQQTLKVAKAQRNDFGKYNYRSLSDILEELKPILKELNLVLFFEDSIKEIGSRFYLETIATLVDTETGEALQNKGIAREQNSQSGMSEAQITGSVSSYARKYCLAGWFLLDESEDQDSNEIKEKEIKVEKTKEKEIEIKKTENDLRKNVGAFIVNNFGLENAKKALKYFTSFKSKDGKEVEGLEKLELLNGQRLKVCYGKIKKLEEENNINKINEIKNEINKIN